MSWVGWGSTRRGDFAGLQRTRIGRNREAWLTRMQPHASGGSEYWNRLPFAASSASTRELRQARSRRIETAAAENLSALADYSVTQKGDYGTHRVAHRFLGAQDGAAHGDAAGPFRRGQSHPARAVGPAGDPLPQDGGGIYRGLLGGTADSESRRSHERASDANSGSGASSGASVGRDFRRERRGLAGSAGRA